MNFFLPRNNEKYTSSQGREYTRHEKEISNYKMNIYFVHFVHFLGKGG